MEDKRFPTGFDPLASVDGETTLLGDNGQPGTLQIKDILALVGEALSVPGVDLTTTGNTPIFEVPAGKIFLIDYLELVITDASGAAVRPNAGFGTVAAPNSIKGSEAVGAEMLTLYGRERWEAGFLNRTVLEGGEILQLEIGAAGNTQHVGTVIAKGLLIDTLEEPESSSSSSSEGSS